jgi:hypothetical protein
MLDGKIAPVRDRPRRVVPSKVSPDQVVVLPETSGTDQTVPSPSMASMPWESGLTNSNRRCG